MQSKSVLLKNMFDPKEYVVPVSSLLGHVADITRETERDWDKEEDEDSYAEDGRWPSEQEVNARKNKGKEKALDQNAAPMPVISKRSNKNA
jgi:hypothetical protein